MLWRVDRTVKTQRGYPLWVFDEFECGDVAALELIEAVYVDHDGVVVNVDRAIVLRPLRPEDDQRPEGALVKVGLYTHDGAIAPPCVYIEPREWLEIEMPTERREGGWHKELLLLVPLTATIWLDQDRGGELVRETIREG